jgi:replication factor A1
VLAKLISKSEIRNVAAGRDGEPHKVSDAMVGDETGCIYLTLWDDNIEKVKDGDTIMIKNGYINLFRGNMRLNVGRYGTLEISETPLAGEVKSENNMSTQVYEQPRRPFRGGDRRDFGGGRRDFGGRDRDTRGGYRPRRY